MKRSTACPSAALASSPYDTAVGGTDFSWCQPSYNSTRSTVQGCSSSNASSYWNTSNSTTQSVGQNLRARDAMERYVRKSALGSIPRKHRADFVGEWPAGTFQRLRKRAISFTAIALQLYFEDTTSRCWRNSWIPVGGSGGASNCVVNNTTSDPLVHLRRDRHQHRIELRQPHPGQRRLAQAKLADLGGKPRRSRRRGARPS